MLLCNKQKWCLNLVLKYQNELISSLNVQLFLQCMSMERNPESFQWETAWWIKEDAPLLNMNMDSSLHSICLHLVPEWIIHSYNLLTGTF